jgi:hypothetical protein
MNDKSNKLKNLIFIILISLLIAPYIQYRFSFINVKPLNGAISQAENIYFSTTDWFSCNYQNQKEKYLNESFGFRNIFVRINNQIAFNLFNTAKANGVIIGKKNYLYEENYIKAYFGQDFIDEDSINHRMIRLKYLQDTLSKLNKNLILIFAAGKGSFYPEYIPNNRKNTVKNKTNYEYHLKFANDLGIDYIDFNSYFLKNKYKSKYPLYPQYGIHWSVYGMCLVADSMISYIENMRHIKMSHIYWNKVDIADAKESDYDIGDGMNLIFGLKSFKMAYPNLQIQSDSGKTKPSILVVSDSYFWGIFGRIYSVFSKCDFWYYNKQIYSANDQNQLETNQVNIKEQIEKHDIIIIMATDANLYGFGWGFIERLCNYFHGIPEEPIHDAEFMNKVKIARNGIKDNREWFNAVIEKAKNKKISVDSMLTLDAIWAVEQELKKK